MRTGLGKAPQFLLNTDPGSSSMLTADSAPNGNMPSNSRFNLVLEHYLGHASIGHVRTRLVALLARDSLPLDSSEGKTTTPTRSKNVCGNQLFHFGAECPVRS